MFCRGVYSLQNAKSEVSHGIAMHSGFQLFALQLQWKSPELLRILSLLFYIPLDASWAYFVIWFFSSCEICNSPIIKIHFPHILMFLGSRCQKKLASAFFCYYRYNAFKFSGVFESKQCKWMAPGFMEIFQLELCRWKLFSNNIWYAFPDGLWYVICMCLLTIWIGFDFLEDLGNTKPTTWLTG